MKTERELVSCKYRGFSCSDLHKYFHLDTDTGDKLSQTRSGKYQARIGLNGKDTYLGSFLTISDAEVAYLEAKKILHINQDYKAMIGAVE